MQMPSLGVERQMGRLGDGRTRSLADGNGIFNFDIAEVKSDSCVLSGICNGWGSGASGQVDSNILTTSLKIVEITSTVIVKTTQIAPQIVGPSIGSIPLRLFTPTHT